MDGFVEALVGGTVTFVIVVVGVGSGRLVEDSGFVLAALLELLVPEHAEVPAAATARRGRIRDLFLMTAQDTDNHLGH